MVFASETCACLSFKQQSCSLEGRCWWHHFKTIFEENLPFKWFWQVGNMHICHLNGNTAWRVGAWWRPLEEKKLKGTFHFKSPPPKQGLSVFALQEVNLLLEREVCMAATSFLWLATPSSPSPTVRFKEVFNWLVGHVLPLFSWRAL